MSALLYLWIASLSLSSGAHSRHPLARNDDPATEVFGCLKFEALAIRRVRRRASL
jgi:hypothetical protein